MIQCTVLYWYNHVMHVLDMYYTYILVEELGVIIIGVYLTIVARCNSGQPLNYNPNAYMLMYN